MEENKAGQYVSFQSNSEQLNASQKLFQWIFSNSLFSENRRFYSSGQWKMNLELDIKEKDFNSKDRKNKQKKKQTDVIQYPEISKCAIEIDENKFANDYSTIKNKKYYNKIIKRSEYIYDIYEKKIEEEKKNKRILENAKEIYLKRKELFTGEFHYLKQTKSIEQKKHETFMMNVKKNPYFILWKKQNRNVYHNSMNLSFKTNAEINKYFEKNLFQQLSYYKIKKGLYSTVIGIINEVSQFYSACERDILDNVKIKYFPSEHEEHNFYIKGLIFSNSSIYFDNIEIENANILLIDTETKPTFEKLDENLFDNNFFNVIFFKNLITTFSLQKFTVFLIQGEINLSVKRFLLHKNMYFFTKIKKKNLCRLSKILQINILNVKSVKEKIGNVIGKVNYFKIGKYKKNVKNIFICYDNNFLTLCIFGGRWIVDETEVSKKDKDEKAYDKKKKNQVDSMIQFREEIQKENILNHFINFYYRNKKDDYILDYFFLNKEKAISLTGRKGEHKRNFEKKRNNKKEKKRKIRRTKKELLINHIKNIIAAKKLKKIIRYCLFLSFYMYKHICINNFMNRVLISFPKGVKKNCAAKSDINVSTSILYAFYLLHPIKKKNTPINLISSVFHLLKMDDPLLCERLSNLLHLVNVKEIIKEQICNLYEFCFCNSEKNTVIDIVNFFLFNNFMRNTQKNYENIFYYVKTINSMYLYYNNHNVLEFYDNDLFLSNVKIEKKMINKIEEIVKSNILFYSYHIKTIRNIEMIIYFICPNYMYINPLYSNINIYWFDTRNHSSINDRYLFYNFFFNYNYIYDISLRHFVCLMYFASSKLMCPFEFCKNVLLHHQICFQVFNKKIIFTIKKETKEYTTQRYETLLLEIMCNKCNYANEQIISIPISLGEFLLCLIHSEHYINDLCRHSSVYTSYTFFYREIKINVQVYENDIYRRVESIQKNVGKLYKAKNEKEKEKEKTCMDLIQEKKIFFYKVEETFTNHFVDEKQKRRHFYERKKDKEKKIKFYIKSNIKKILRNNVFFCLPCNCLMTQESINKEKKKKERKKSPYKELCNFSLNNIIEYFPYVNNSILPMYTSLKFLIYSYIVKYYRSQNKHLYVDTKKRKKTIKYHNPCDPLYFKNACSKCKYIKIFNYSTLILVNLLFIIKRLFCNFDSFLDTFLHLLIKNILIKREEIHMSKNDNEQRKKKSMQFVSSSYVKWETINNKAENNVIVEQNSYDENIKEDHFNNVDELYALKEPMDVINNGKHIDTKMNKDNDINSYIDKKKKLANNQEEMDCEELQKEYFLLKKLKEKINKYRKLFIKIYEVFYSYALVNFSKKNFSLDVDIFFSFYIIIYTKLTIEIEESIQLIEQWRSDKNKKIFLLIKKRINKNVWKCYKSRCDRKIKKRKMSTYIKKGKKLNINPFCHFNNLKKKKKEKNDFCYFSNGSILKWFRKEKKFIYSVENNRRKRSISFMSKENYPNFNRKYFYMHIAKIVNLEKRKKKHSAVFFLNPTDVSNIIFHSLLSSFYKKRLQEIYTKEKKSSMCNENNDSICNSKNEMRAVSKNANFSIAETSLNKKDNLILRKKKQKTNIISFKNIRKYIYKKKSLLYKPINEKNIRNFINSSNNEVVSVCINKDITVHIYFPLQFYFLRKCLCKHETTFLSSIKKSDFINVDLKKKKFIKTYDDAYIIKEINKYEFTLYINKFKQFFHYFSEVLFENKVSVLCLIYGLFQIEIKKKNKKIVKTYIILENVKIHKKNANVLVFDIKGARKKKNLQTLILQNDSSFLLKGKGSFIKSDKEIKENGICTSVAESLFSEGSFNLERFKKYLRKEKKSLHKHYIHKLEKEGKERIQSKGLGEHFLSKCDVTKMREETDMKSKKLISEDKPNTVNIIVSVEDSSIQERVGDNSKEQGIKNRKIENIEKNYAHIFKINKTKQENWNHSHQKKNYLCHISYCNMHWNFCRKKVSVFKIRKTETSVEELETMKENEIHNFVENQKYMTKWKKRKNQHTNKKHKLKYSILCLHFLSKRKSILNKKNLNNYKRICTKWKEEEEKNKSLFYQSQTSCIEYEKKVVVEIEDEKEDNNYGSAYPLKKYSPFTINNSSYDPTNMCYILFDDNFKDFIKGRTVTLEYSDYKFLSNALKNDTDFLSSLDIMDYSLLIHIDIQHFQILFKLIDYLRPYTWDKSVENFSKSVLYLAKGYKPTIIPSEYYKIRFLDNIKKYFFYYVPLYIFEKKVFYHILKNKGTSMWVINTDTTHDYKKYFFPFLFHFLVNFGNIEYVKNGCAEKIDTDTNLYSVKYIFTILAKCLINDNELDENDKKEKINQLKNISSLKYLKIKDYNFTTVHETCSSKTHKQMTYNTNLPLNISIAHFSPTSTKSEYNFLINHNSQNFVEKCQEFEMHNEEKIKNKRLLDGHTALDPTGTSTIEEYAWDSFFNKKEKENNHKRDENSNDSHITPNWFTSRVPFYSGGCIKQVMKEKEYCDNIKEIPDEMLNNLKKEIFDGITKLQITILKKLQKKMNISNIKNYVSNNVYLETQHTYLPFSNISYVDALNMYRIYEATQKRKKKKNKIRITEKSKGKKKEQLLLYVPSFFLFSLHK